MARSTSIPCAAGSTVWSSKSERRPRRRCVFVALAYSLVGHGGASGYLALLAFTSVDQETASTTALGLNLVVAGVTFFTFRRAKHFSWSMVWPILVGSFPSPFWAGHSRWRAASRAGFSPRR